MTSFEAPLNSPPPPPPPPPAEAGCNRFELPLVVREQLRR